MISGNDGEGLLLYNNAEVQGNKIGTDQTGSGALGNGGNGILIKGDDNQIGGYGMFNTIAFNGRHGVAVISESGGATGNAIYTEFDPRQRRARDRDSAGMPWYPTTRRMRIPATTTARITRC